MNEGVVGAGVVTDGTFYVNLAYAIVLIGITLYSLSLALRARAEEIP